MSVKLLVVGSYVKALEKSSLKERSQNDYFRCLGSNLHDIQGDKVLFRSYINECEYWEYAFKRGKEEVEFLYTTYGVE